MELMVFLVFVLGISSTYGDLTLTSMDKIMRISEKGTYIGIVVPHFFELNPLLQSTSFLADPKLPYVDYAGKRFRFGRLENKGVVIVMTGLNMINAGVTTRLLLMMFKVQGVMHYGIAGNADPHLQIGDVTIAQYWAHAGRCLETRDDEFSLTSFGDYPRQVGQYFTHGTVSNLVNSIWYQPDEVFPVHGTPEVREFERAFWVPVNHTYLALAKKLEVLKLWGCVNTTCLPRAPIVVRVERGLSANVDNSATRELLKSKFNATSIDMESAAVALVCHQRGKPFIVIRALSDLAGRGSSVSNEASTFASLAAQNAVDVVIRFIGLLSS